MNLVTTKDNWMSLSMFENPHVPGNYEPGDDRRQHETSLDSLLHMAGNIVSRVHIWARPQWMSLREATDSGIDWYLLVLDQASLQRSAGKTVELFSPCEAEGSIWTFPTFGCQTWERAWNSIWLERDDHAEVESCCCCCCWDVKFLNSCVWTFSTFGYEIWERALNSIWLERMQRLSPVVVVVLVDGMWSLWNAFLSIAGRQANASQNKEANHRVQACPSAAITQTSNCRNFLFLPVGRRRAW